MTGATDTVSMVIRNIVRQLETPDRLRGRMAGVNMVLHRGPQLGEFEAGAVANWLGAPFSVVSGGVGCLSRRPGRVDDTSAQTLHNNSQVSRLNSQELQGRAREPS